MNRGSTTALPASSPQPDRFNEAPIHESGKWAGPGAGHPMGFRFNEAPIHESGKLQIAKTVSFNRPGASMRPRFMNRGSDAQARILGKYIELQ